MNEIICRAGALYAGYGGKAVVKNVSLEAAEGQVVALVGPNGAGKSTLLKTLIGQLPVIAGEVSLCGQDIKRIGEKEIARLCAAVLTEKPSPELMTCAEVAEAGRYPYTGRLGLLRKEDREKAEEAMRLTGTWELWDRPFRQVSDGQRQMVLLSRALCQEPRLLVLDEPTSFLDIRHKLDFLLLLRSLARERRLAIILSLHELDLAQKFSDRVVCLKEGAVDRAGEPEEIFAGHYIEELYDVRSGSYDSRFGSVEPLKTGREPKVFVIGGGGSGISLYRKLYRSGIPFAAGVLAENDMDMPAAEALAERVFSSPSFESIKPGAVDEAITCLAACERLYCCRESFGEQDRENRRLLDWAEKRKIPVVFYSSIQK